MTFSAVSTIVQTSAATISLNPTAAGSNFFLLNVITVSNTVWASGVSGGNCTWTQLGTKYLGSTSGIADYTTLWLGTATGTGSATATITFSGATPTIRAAGQQFSSSAGSWAADGSPGIIDFGTTNTYVSLTPAGAGDLYFGFAFWNGTCTNGSTSGYTYQQDSHGNGMVYDAACTSAAQAPVWGSSAPILGMAVLLKETPAAVSGRSLVVSQAATRAAYY